MDLTIPEPEKLDADKDDDGVEPQDKPMVVDVLDDKPSRACTYLELPEK